MKLGNAEIVISREGEISTSKLLKFLKEKVKLNLVPVRGQYDAYWLSGKDGYDMIDGNKYYKLTLNGYGIEINCTGDYNAFSMKGSLLNWMKAELPTPLVDEAA
jgi:hypothetical protein|tara:strand:+ start:63 stop:374 length:312 start_codon:yes stop_codon:yes gene_type:complete